jgi:hypothetical protein
MTRDMDKHSRCPPHADKVCKGSVYVENRGGDEWGAQGRSPAWVPPPASGGRRRLAEGTFFEPASKRQHRFARPSSNPPSSSRCNPSLRLCVCKQRQSQQAFSKNVHQYSTERASAIMLTMLPFVSYGFCCTVVHFIHSACR